MNRDPAAYEKLLQYESDQNESESSVSGSSQSDSKGTNSFGPYHHLLSHRNSKDAENNEE